MTITEVLPTLRQLNRADKIRVVQFLVNEIAREENVFSENQEHDFVSQTDSFEASRVLQKLLDEKKADANT